MRYFDFKCRNCGKAWATGFKEGPIIELPFLYNPFKCRCPRCGRVTAAYREWER